MSDEYIQTLISAVFKRKAIWEQNHAEHHNRFKLSKLWKEVAKTCGKPICDVKKKWKTLRQQFKEKWEKHPRYMSGYASSTDAEQWPYFESLLFLRDNFEPSAASRNLSSRELNETEENSEYLSDSGEADSQPTASFAPVSTSLSFDSPETPPTSATAERLRYRKRPRPIDSSGIQVTEVEKLRNHIENEPQSLDNQDEDVAFFMSLLPHVRRLIPFEKMTFRIDVQKLVMEKLYGSKDREYRINAPAPQECRDVSCSASRLNVNNHPGALHRAPQSAFPSQYSTAIDIRTAPHHINYIYVKEEIDTISSSGNYDNLQGPEGSFL